MKSKYKKLGENLFLITLGNFSSRLLGFLFIPFYTSVLSTDEYGTADLITTTVSLLFPVFTMVICEAMMRFSLDKKENKEEIWNAGLFVWGVGLLVLLLLLPLIRFIPVLSPYALFLVLYYTAYSFNFNTSYFVRGIEKIKLYSIAGVFQTVLTISLNLYFLLYLKIGLQGYLLSFIIANFLTGFLLLFGAKVYKYHIKLPKKELLIAMLLFSIPLIPNQLGWWINNSADRFFLIAYCGTSINGLYSVAHKIPTILYVLISIFSSAWRISSVDGYGTDENVRFYNNVYDKYITVSLVGASLLISVNKIIAYFLYAKEFYIAYTFVPLLILAVFFNGLGEYVGSIYIAHKRTRPLMITTLIGAIINIGLNFLLVPLYGGIGAATATMVGFAAIWVIRLVDSRRILKLQTNISSIVCMTILLAQVVIWLLELKYAFIFNLIMLVVIIYLRKEIITIVINKAKTIKKRPSIKKEKSV